MSGDQGEHPEERLAETLAAFDDLLAAGCEQQAEALKQAVDPELLPEWNRLSAFLTLVERAWPRAATDPDRRTDPAPTGKSADAASTGAENAVDFGHFRILRTLGQGGFGIVFLAWDPAMRRQVALKVPQPETLVTPEARKRFLREAQAAGRLDHPNIVPVYETGSVGAVTYIAAAYCPGPTLAGWLKRQSRSVLPRDAAVLVADLARAIEHAHERGVLHRDLKPSNVLLQRLGANGHALADDESVIRLAEFRESEPPFDPAPGARLPRLPPQPAHDQLAAFQARITDFSLAWLADGEGPKTQSGVPLGTPAYMAPEQAQGRLNAIGPPTDVYGLGCILYELLTGIAPFHGPSRLEILKQVTADDPIPPRRVSNDIPIELDAIVLKCLEKDPVRRYPTARELADDVDRFLAGEPTLARPAARWLTLLRKAKRRPAALVVLSVVVSCTALLLIGGFWYEARLNAERRLSREKDDLAQVRGSSNRRRLEYVRDIRQAEQLIRAFRAPLALEILLRHRPRAGEDDLRDFAWYLLFRRCHTELRTLTGHHGEVYYVEFSPRGDLLASASKDGTVQIWNTTSWNLDRKITASEKEVNVATFSPDGKSIATVDDEGKLKLWEIASGHCQLEKLAHNGDAVIARFTPDGKRVITGGRKDRFVRIWDRSTGVMVDALPSIDPGLIDPALENAAFSPDGSVLATSGSSDVNLWNAATRLLIASIPGSRGAQGLAFSHDGTKLATSHEGDRTVRLWDVSSHHLVREFRGHSEGVFSVAFSRDDQTIISAGDDGTIRFWNAASGMQRGAHQGHNGRVWTVALSPDGHTIASAGHDGTVRLWDNEPPQGLPRLPIPKPMCFVFLDDGRTLMTVERGRPWLAARWDAHSGLLLEKRPLDLPDSDHWSNLSPDGQILAAVNPEGKLALWNTATGRQQSVHDLNVERFAPQFSPDGRYLLVLCRVGNSWSLWDLANRCSIPVPWDKAGLAGFTPSGQVIVGDHDSHFFWWDPSTGRSRTASLQRVARTWGATVSADGHTLASVDPSTRKIHVWSTQTRELQLELPGHPGKTDSLAFSPNGRTLASSGADGAVKLWDIATGEELLTLEGYPGMVTVLRFSPDGRALATMNSAAGDRWEVCLWRTAADETPPTAEGEGAAAPIKR